MPPSQFDLTAGERELIIGPAKYRVSYERGVRNGSEALYADHDSEALVIRVSTDAPPQRRPIALLHEIFHALEDQAGLEFTEPQLETISFQLAGILRHNPEMVLDMLRVWGHNV